MQKRNEKCACGSGKKYKYCCMQKDMEAARLRQDQPSATYEENPTPKLSTPKLVLIATALLSVIALIIALVGYTRIAGAIFGCGMIVLILYAAFRNVPTLRKKPGNAGNIDFGNR